MSEPTFKIGDQVRVKGHGKIAKVVELKDANGTVVIEYTHEREGQDPLITQGEYPPDCLELADPTTAPNVPTVEPATPAN